VASLWWVRRGVGRIDGKRFARETHLNSFVKPAAVVARIVAPRVPPRVPPVAALRVARRALQCAQVLNGDVAADPVPVTGIDEGWVLLFADRT
jgi:hypothetical protein